MPNPIRCLTIAVILAAAATVAAANPGSKWRITVSVSAQGMSLPAQVSEMCVAGGGQDPPPPPSGQNDCQYTETARTGNTVRYAIECKAMKGTGQISYSADHYSGKFDLQGEHGPVSSTYEGQKLGTCDAAQASNATRSSAADTSSSSVAAAANAASAVGTEVKDTAAAAATDAAQSAKDDAKESVKDKATGVLKGLFGR